MTSTTYGLLGPLLLLAFGIGFGARSVAGDERDGVLAVELAQPITRAEASLGRLLAGIVQLAILVIAVTLSTRITASIVGMEVTTGQLIEGADGLFTFAVPWLATSWAIAAISGRRDLAVGDTSPFHWYLESDLLVVGPDRGVLAFAIATTLVMATIGATVFARRDIAS